MVSMKAAYLILKNANVGFFAVVPDTDQRIHIRTAPYLTDQSVYIAHIIQAFRVVRLQAERIVQPKPKHPAYASQWLTFRISI